MLTAAPGEDPYLTGEYATYYTQGMQEAPEDPYHVQASACCKHYVANSMDGTTEADGEHHDRNHVDSEVPMQDLIDSYMFPFQACVEKGRVTGLMCSCASAPPFGSAPFPSCAEPPRVLHRQCGQRGPELRQRLAADRGRPRGVGL